MARERCHRLPSSASSFDLKRAPTCEKLRSCAPRALSSTICLGVLQPCPLLGASGSSISASAYSQAGRSRARFSAPPQWRSSPKSPLLTIGGCSGLHRPQSLIASAAPRRAKLELLHIIAGSKGVTVSKKPPKKKNQPGKTAASQLYSSLGAHKFVGGKLLPPLNLMEKMRQSSWMNDHLPLMLWAALVGEVFPRDDFLGCLRSVLNDCAPWFGKGGPLAAADKPPPADGDINFTSVLDMQTLAQMPDELFSKFVSIPLRHPLGHAALRPLLLLDSLSNAARWRAALDVRPQDDDWNTLVLAVGSTLNHQSQRSTDLRWFKVMTPLIAGISHYPREMEEKLSELYEYPNRGDQRSVRPHIRASEMTFRRSPVPKWVAEFWTECATKTRCVDPTNLDDERRTETKLSAQTVLGARDGVIGKFFASMQGSAIDARHDSAFGLVLYALAVVQELAMANTHEDIMGRMSLRSLVESAITLNYLAKKDEAALWSSWRVYGAGQAKLTFLKNQELAGDTPKFYEAQALEQIANEDQWQEFLNIEIGHWAGTNLRSMAKAADRMDLYESYYAWTSTFAHSHWAAVRDTNFITCHNPLHRLHRIPRLLPRRAASVEADAAKIVNGMFDVLEKLYPQGDPIHRLELDGGGTGADGPGEWSEAVQAGEMGQVPSPHEAPRGEARAPGGGAAGSSGD